MRDYNFFVYLLASRRNGTLYCGVTNDLLRRVVEHRDGTGPGFTQRHGVFCLVWFEQHSDIAAAILREKRIKKWNRSWKVALIEAANRDWRDLAVELGLDPPTRMIPTDAKGVGQDQCCLPRNGSPPSRG